MTDAKNVQKNDKATQEEVDAAVKALNEAAAGLVKKPEPPVEVNKKALDDAIKANSGKSKDDYTEDSWTKFDKAMTDAKNVQKNDKATQEEVDAAVKALNDAAKALEKKPAPTEKPTATPAPTNKPNNSNSNNNNSTSNSAASTAKPSQATPTPASTRVPQTSDSFPIVPLAAVALLSLNGLIVLILRKREKHK